MAGVVETKSSGIYAYFWEKYEKFDPKLFNSWLVDSGHVTLDGCSTNP